MSNVWRSL